MNLTSYRTLGRSGLVVSPFALGTMTFGNKSWGSRDDSSKSIVDAYLDAGGNFIDTADIYSGGRSEELVGKFIAERSLRDKVVLATKFTWNAQGGNPNAGGNGRKHIHRALEGSLRRLKTDYIDLYWLHAWDRVTPVEEVLQTLGDLVRAGRIRYFGFSNIPAWYVAKAATLAAVHHVPGFVLTGHEKPSFLVCFGRGVKPLLAERGNLDKTNMPSLGWACSLEGC
jgi:aryl-alcohol dehydrogenase-like predicted oxidoreductase